jgi:hypothetical protein
MTKKFRKRLHKEWLYDRYYDLQYAFYYFIPIWITFNGYFSDGTRASYTEQEGKYILKSIKSKEDAKNFVKKSKSYIDKSKRNIYL